MEVDFNIVVSIPKTQNIGKGNKCVTHYLLVVEATSSTTQEVWQWMKARRYSEFHGLYQEMKKKFPDELKKVHFPPKKMFNRMSSAVIAERRVMLEEFLGVIVEDLNIINTDTHLRAFLEIDKTLTPIILREREREASHRERERDLLPSEQELEEDSAQQYARVLFSFEPTSEDEISLTSGEYVIIHTVREDGWCEGQIHGEIGFFPECFVEMVDELPENPDDVIVNQVQAQAPALPKPRVPCTLNEDVQQKRRKELMNRLRWKPKRKTAFDGTMASKNIPYVTGTALFKFQGKSDLEISFLRGDSIVVYNIDQESGWWQGQVRDCIGYFPGSYVSLPDGSEESLISMLEQYEVVPPVDRPVSSPSQVTPLPKPLPDPPKTKPAPSPTPAPAPAPTPPPSTVIPKPKPPAAARPLPEHPIRVRGNSISPAKAQEFSANNPILQQIMKASSTDYMRKCIMCPCDHWCPSAHEKKICENCRHLYRMHRTLSKMG